MDPTESERIRQAISEARRDRVDVIEVFSEIESTNTYLMDQSPPMPGNWRVAVADHQTSGRGRMNNEWHSPPMSGLYMSTALTFARMPNHFSCLTLAIGISIVQALHSLGANKTQLKWPNDLVLNNGKLGGILTELQAGSGESVTVVIGVGINVQSGGKMDYVASAIGRVAELVEGVDQLPERWDLVSTIVDSMMRAADKFAADGFANFHELWTRYDWLLGRDITAESAVGSTSGTVMGIDHDGALLINTGDELRRVMSGTIAVINPLQTDGDGD
jgi:BirA family biotin operon repressor/biotin-[acetyl-CoA-carboxylase] ligase